MAISQTPFQMCQSLNNWEKLYSLFLLYRIIFSIVVCFGVQHINATTLLILSLLCLIVYLSIIFFYYSKIIVSLQGSIDRTVKEMIKNDLVKEVKELEMFGSRVNKRKMSLFRHKNNETLWMRACKSVDIKNMKYLLTIDPNTDVNEFDTENNQTGIIFATIKGSIDAVKLLLKHPQINVNHCDIGGCNALLYSIQDGYFEITQLLLGLNADVNVTDYKNHHTPIMYALIKGDIKTAKLLLDNPNIDLNICDKNGCSALFYAIHNKHLEIATLIAESGANLNAVGDHDQTHKTQLMIALEHGKNDVAKWMLHNGVQYGLDTSIKDIYNNTAWIYCWNDIAMVKLYVEYHTKNDIQLDINETDSNGQTLLTWSLVRSQKNSIEYLFEIGPSMGLKTNLIDVGDDNDDNNDNNNITWLTCCDDITILILYVKYHIDHEIRININEIDSTGQTLLMKAIIQGKHDIVEYLFKIGVVMRLDTSIKDNWNNSAWIYCWNDFMLVKKFIEYHNTNDLEMNVNEVDSNGQTLLRKAIIKQEMNIVEYLFKIGESTGQQLKLNGEKKNVESNLIFKKIYDLSMTKIDVA